MTEVRSVVFSGWLGRATSGGMGVLAVRLGRYGPTSFYSWREARTAARVLATSTSPRCCVVGYSLGGEMLFLVDQLLERVVDLGVAYDPRGYADKKFRDAAGVYQLPLTGFRRVVCYTNRSTWNYPQVRYVGANVVEREINEFHLTVQFDHELHAQTEEEVRKLAET